MLKKKYSLNFILIKNLKSLQFEVKKKYFKNAYISPALFNKALGFGSCTQKRFFNSIGNTIQSSETGFSIKFGSPLDLIIK